jgi:hypothetical protein
VSAPDLSRAEWRKSRYSQQNGECVEVASHLPGAPALVAVRDSKDPAGPALTFTSAEFTAFLRGVTNGTFE